MLMKGQALSVTDTSNKSWYKVNLTYSSKKYTGFISSSLITMGTYKEPDGNQTSDAAFEKQLSAQNFPESYKVLLRKLHAEHPNWIFKAVHTNLNWNDVVKNEVNVQGRVNNLVNCLPVLTTAGDHRPLDTTTRQTPTHHMMVQHGLQPRTIL